MLQSFAEEEPHNPFNWYALAMEFIKDDPLEAEKLMGKLLTEFPDYLPTYYHAAHLYGQLDQIQKAAAVFEKGIRLSETQQDTKANKELKNSYLNFRFENDLG